jgi:hypothetical protein
MDLPTLSHSIIRNLGATFCKIDPSKLSLEELSMVKKPFARGGRSHQRNQPKVPMIMMCRGLAKRRLKIEEWQPIRLFCLYFVQSKGL